jgi:hypothetical protein
MADKWSLLLKFDKSGLATKQNGADIPDNMLQTAAHCVFDNGVLEVAPGRTAKYTQLESGASVDGIFRSWDKSGNRDTLVACNGKLKYDSGAAWTDLLTGLTAGIDYDFKNWKDRTFIINGTDDAREFFPRTNAIQKAGLEPPRFYKKVAYFETDETINTGSGIEVDTVTFRPTERTGSNSRSLKLTAAASATTAGYVTYSTAQNFSIYPNGGSVSDNDFVCVSIFHRTRAYVSSITLDFYTSSGNYYRATIEADELDPIIQRNNQWTDIKIRRSRFVATGSPNWASVARFYANLTAVTGEAVVNIDNVYIKNSPIIASSYGKDIDTFEGASGDYTVANCAVSNNMDYRYVKKGTKSLKFVRSGATATFYKTVSLNLAYHVDGVASPTSDEITIWVYGATTNLTSIAITLYSDTATPKHFSHSVAPGEHGLRASSSGVWSQIAIAKSLFVDTGTADWSAIVRAMITVVTSGACTLYFDDFKLDEKALELSILTMSTTEGWTWSNTGSYNTNQKYRVEGASSVYIKCPAKKSYSTQASIAVDLTEFDTGETSSNDDLICFWMMWDHFKTIQKIEVYFDINDGDFGDAYFYEITPEYLVSALAMNGKPNSKMNSQKIDMEIPKADFTRIGVEVKDWSDVATVKFLVYGASSGSAVTVYFDDLHMRRKTGLTGIYQFATAFVNSNNEPSALSEWSDQVELSGSRAVLSLIPVSQDTNVIGRWIFRKGGSLGDDARLDETIWDNTTTTYYCGIEDYETGILASDVSIPQGTIRFPSITKFGPVYKDRLTGFGDSEHPEYLYFSNTGFWYAWSELQAWKFDSKVLDAWVDDDVLFVNTHLGIRRIRVDLGELTADDIEEIGVVKHSMGAWASCPVEGMRAFVSYDGVYLMNGSQVQGPISDLIENKFTGGTYTLASTKAIYRNKHLYLSMLATATRSLLDCSFPGHQWRTSDYAIRCFCIFDGPGDTQQLYGGTTDGYIYQLDTGYASTLAVTTKDYQAVSANPFEEVVLTEIWVKAKSAEASAGAVTIQFRIDQTLNTTITKTFPSTGHIANVYTTYFEQLMGINDYLKGSKIGMTIAPSVAGKHLAIEAILLKGEIAKLPKILEEG